jgi:hypothetical protein
MNIKKITQFEIDKVRSAQQICIADMYNVLGVPISERECPECLVERGALIYRLTEWVEAIE